MLYQCDLIADTDAHQIAAVSRGIAPVYVRKMTGYLPQYLLVSTQIGPGRYPQKAIFPNAAVARIRMDGSLIR